MPRKRKGADLSRNTSKTRSKRNLRSERSEEEIQQETTDARVSMARLRQEQSEDTRAERNEVIRLQQRQSRDSQPIDAEQTTSNANRYTEHLHLIHSCG